MKSWIVLTMAVLAVAFLGGKGKTGTDVGKLRPVEVLWVRMQDDSIYIVTDMGDSGMGENVKSAARDLKRKASGEVFLDTGEFLLVDENAQSLIPELIEMLRPSCMICLVQGKVDMEQVGAYLRSHPPERNLAQYQACEQELEILKISKGGMELVS